MTEIEFTHKILSLEDNLERFALSLTADRDEAKDLLQETYLKAITHRDKFEEYTNLKAWIYTIMKNTFINNYRKAVRENTTIDTTKDLYYLNNAKTSSMPHPDSDFRTQEIKSQIEALDDDFKIPFKMHTQGYKYKEIADHLDLKIGTVKSRIFFTRKKLMEALADYK